jgi:hypothetical protein
LKTDLVGPGQVQAYGPIDIVVIDRRQFLRLAGGTLIALGTVGLFGCGGGGGGGGGSVITQGMGLIQLPAGVTANKIGPLSTANALGNRAVSSKMSFSTPVLSLGPSLIHVVNSAGIGVMMGFVDPKAANNVISPQSTAVAMIYLVLGFHIYPDANRAQILSLVTADSATSILASVIAARMAANPTALGQGDAQIANAVVVACQSIMASAGSSGKTSAPQKFSSRQGVATPFSPPPEGVTVLPANTMQSQAEIDTTATPSDLKILGTNAALFERSLYVYKIGHVDTTGNFVAIPPALVTPPIEMKSVDTLGPFTALLGLLPGHTLYENTQTSPLVLSVDTGFTQTRYGAVVVGPGKQNFSSPATSPPAVFNNTTYLGEVADWQLASTGLFRKAALKGFISIFLEALGLNFSGPHAGHGSIDPFEGLVFDTLIENLEGISNPTWKAAIEEFFQGDFPSAFVSLLEAVFGDPTVASQFFGYIFTFAVSFLSLAGVTALSEKYLEAAGKVFLEDMIAVYHVATVTTVIAQLIAEETAMLKADVAELWNITVAVSTVTLSPVSASVTPGASPTTFTATLTPPLGGTIVYDWVLTGGVAAVLVDSAKPTNKGTKIETTGPSVSLVTADSDTKPMSLQVQGFLVTSGARISLGIATAPITIKAPGRIPLDTTYTVLSFPPDPDNYNRGYVIGVYTFTLPPEGSPYQTLSFSVQKAGDPVGGEHFSDFEPLVPYNTGLLYTDPVNQKANAVGNLAAMPNGLNPTIYFPDTVATLSVAQASVLSEEIVGGQVVWIDQ